jgi:FkbM family methyltransferase
VKFNEETAVLDQDFQEYLNWTYFSRDAFDRSEFDRLEKILQGVTRFIDVGASHGVFTYHANNILKNAEIYAIEADPERFAILKENTKKWSATTTNTIHCINAAASDEIDRKENTEITFYTTGTQISGGLFSVSERSDKYAPIKIPLICVDDFYDPSAKTFVKIDVEGAELRVLEGASETISSGNAQFFTEISWWGDRDRSTTALDVLKFIYKSGLRADRRLRSDYLMTPEANTRARFLSIIKCLPPLLTRVTYDTIVPKSLRTMRERLLNRKRMSKYSSRTMV